ncbi:DUF4197 domain-containing protein [Catalinimonas alkaloidigena]|nr:DUF4197 domain-containing protein [Catalinimonas alkaloidigena]
MKRLRYFTLTLALLSLFSLNSCKEVLQVVSQNLPLSEEEIISGLKSALQVGTDTAVANLTRVDGFYKDAAVKILLPPQAQGVIDKLNSSAAGRTLYKAALQPLVDDMVMSLNRSAEDAAQKATPIFVDAIRNITIRDGLNILYGPDTAATNYLRSNTFSRLSDAFEPSINQSLSKPLLAGRSANDLYNNFVNTYNKVANNPLNSFLGLQKIDDSNLSTYVTNKALDGVFLKIAREEKMIRENPGHRVNDILKRVFGKLDSPNAQY